MAHFLIFRFRKSIYNFYFYEKDLKEL